MENSVIPSYGVYLGTGFDQPDKRPALPANPFTREYRHLGPPAPQAAADTLTIVAKNIRRWSYDVQRARVACGAKLDVKSDGPLTVELLGCSGSQARQIFGS